MFDGIFRFRNWKLAQEKNNHFIFVLESDISPRYIQKRVENPSYTRINFEEYNCNYVIILLHSTSVYLPDNLGKWSKHRKIIIAL